MGAKKDKKTTDLEEKVEVVEEVSKKLLSLMEIDLVPKVSTDEDNQAIRIDIDAGDEAGLLIGSRGYTLNSLQMIIGLLVRKETDEWVRVLVDVADWRDKEKERLNEIAEQAAERAVATGEPQHLYNLTPAQRRLVHIALSGDNRVTTESEGEGEERYLVVLRSESN
jgi:spoIIIJ-associated protein